MTYLPIFRHILIASALFLAGDLAVQAQSVATDVPRTISYQGLLTSTDGTPFVDGEYRLTVTLYADEQGTRRVWHDTYTTPVAGGVFNLYLGGEGRPLPESGTMNTPLWIGTSVDGAMEMRPLTPLSASPYALNVPDKAITTGKVADGAITGEKLGVDYVSAVQINGETIGAKGAVLNLVGTPSVPLTYDEATQSVTIGRSAMHIVDSEKGSDVLGGATDSWAMQGGGVTPAGIAVAADGNDWIGTANAFDFIAKVNNQQVMQYQQTGTSIPNVIGGQGNTITNAVASIIAEGTGNGISGGDYNSIGGGSYLTITAATNSGIGAGLENTINFADNAFIGGGFGNYLTSDNGFVGGGFANSIGTSVLPTSDFNVIGGGNSNQILGGTTSESFIGGGSQNTVDDASNSVIGGGSDNLIDDGSEHATIGGGELNLIRDSDFGTIGGGEGNGVVRSPYGTIPGGDQLVTYDSYAQTAVGFFNSPRGTMGVRPNAATIAASNDPLFMVGNGSIPGNARSNAFEVSYNGHSVVYGELGISPGPFAVEGATYADNIIYGWGEITGPGGINSGFGIGGVAHVLGTGVYTITLNLTDPTTLPMQAPFTTLAVTATLNDNSCAFINVVRNAAPANTFTVNIHNASCLPVDLPFTFHVTGRR